MRVELVLASPTQFDAPFFRFLSATYPGTIHVVYLDRRRLTDRFFDPELETEVSWGIDLVGGYPYSVIPARHRLRWLISRLRNTECDSIIISGYRGKWEAATALTARMLGIPSALRLDSVLFGDNRHTRLVAKKALFALLKLLYVHFFAVGRASYDYLECVGVEEKRISVFPYTADTEYFRRRSHLSKATRRDRRDEWGLPQEDRVILAVAKFNSREAPWDLLHAFAAMRTDGLHLWLVGDGPQRCGLEKFMREHNMSNVTFGGYVAYQELPLAYGVADLFVHPARYEPWGVSVQEAVAAGLPVIASSKVGAARDFVLPGFNGFIYRAGDAEDLRRRLEDWQYMLDPNLVAECNRRMLERSEYSVIWDGVVRALERYAG